MRVSSVSDLLAHTRPARIDCLEWTGRRDPAGYGWVAIEGKGRQRAHRVVCEMTHGPMSSDQQACHTCDNPPCINPAHLFVGTALANAADRDRKGRGTRGRPRVARQCDTLSPTVDAMRERHVARFSVQCSDSELTLLDQAAAIAGVTRNRFIRMFIADLATPDNRRKMVAKLTRHDALD